MAVNIFRRIRNRWDAYLKKLGEANKKTFGEGPLECCTLNRYEQSSGETSRHTAQ